MAASDKSVVVSSTTDFSSDSTVSDDWQELTKSDYAKVIFSDLLCNAASGTVECKFQITDNVHEDPSDYVGLFRIGYEDLSQCLVSKMLSQTKCEDDGKLQRCVFTSNELPCLSDGFYQFLYVTRDQEVCGASMPFQIKMSPPPSKESSVNSSASEAMDGGFLLVSNETERKVKEEPNEQGEASVQQSTLSEQKKEEIAAWVSQNPDYYSLIEQIREHTFTIDALQQSKDLAMKEVAELYEVLNRQNNELIQVKNMVAAYEEKIKMSQCLQDEKNAAIAEMRKSLALYEEQVKLQEVLKKEKDGELSIWITKSHLQEETLKENLSFQNQQRTEIINLKKELEEMKEMQKAKKYNQITAEAGTHSMDCLIQKAQDFVHIVSDAIKSLDYTNDNEVEKFYQLKIQLLIILRKMTKATDIANTCERRNLDNTNPSVVERSSHVVCAVCSVADQDPVEASAANTSTPEAQETVIPTSSVQTPSLPGSSEKEPANEDTAKEVVQKSSFNKAFESEVLEHQIIDLPRLDVINEDTAKTLQTDKPLDAEDITAINRLTERIIKRGFNLYEAIELLDDSASDSGSDVSEISECTSFIKKDMLCVSRVMDALSSYLSNQTSLDHLIVVEKEEDKSLIHRNKWDELLQKCALHYQIELLLEHIEKQKEGFKKVSEKICDLLTKCMLLKDEVGESKADYEKLQSVIEKKDSHISSLKRELDFKTTLLSHFHKKNEELEGRIRKRELLEKTVEDYRARLEEAADLYKKQYMENARLSKKVEKYKCVIGKTKSSKGESCLVSSGSSRTSSSFEVVKEDSVQNINDSDTGEHMFEKASLVSKEKNQHPSTVDRFPAQSFLDVLNGEASVSGEPRCNTPTEEHPLEDEEIQVQINPNIPERHLATPAAAFDDVPPSNPEVQIVESESWDFAAYEEFQEVIKESFANVTRPTTRRNSQECWISCYICNEIFRLGPETPVDLMNHLENEHSMKTCPVCGQLFEDAIPQRYFQIHVEQHFETQ